MQQQRGGKERRVTFFISFMEYINVYVAANCSTSASVSASTAAAAAAGNHSAARRSASAVEVSAAAAIASSNVVADITPGTTIAALAIASANSARDSAALAVDAANMIAPGNANMIVQQYQCTCEIRNCSNDRCGCRRTGIRCYENCPCNADDCVNRGWFG